jgi:hypothetical protein
MLKKLMFLAAMLAIMAVAAAPVVAQVVVEEFEIEEAESGDAEPEFTVENTGDSSNICVGGVQSTNTGNVQNIQGVNQYAIPESDDIEFEGSSIVISPEAEIACEQTISQSAAAA